MPKPGFLLLKKAAGQKIPAPGVLGDSAMAALGAMIAIAATAWLSDITGAPLLMAPFGASCFLAFVVPESPLAQPRNIVFGHVLSTAAGLVTLYLAGDGLLAIALSVGMAIFLMQITGTGHPPAGADPLLVFALQPGPGFLVFPVFSGACIIVICALAFNNLRDKRSYPKV